MKYCDHESFYVYGMQKYLPPKIFRYTAKGNKSSMMQALKHKWKIDLAEKIHLL